MKSCDMKGCIERARWRPVVIATGPLRSLRMIVGIVLCPACRKRTTEPHEVLAEPEKLAGALKGSVGEPITLVLDFVRLDSDESKLFERMAKKEGPKAS